jgi:23S rRNA pseudouridine2604 synthase
VVLKGAQPGQIAHLCEAVGLQVLSMKRIRLGRVPLGKLPPGQWRYLRGDERFGAARLVCRAQKRMPTTS